MKEQIKKFWNEHETLQTIVKFGAGVVVGVGAMACMVDGAKAMSADTHDVDGKMAFLTINHKNGKKTLMKVTEPKPEV